MSHPELPYLAASGIGIAGATIRDGKLPPLGRVVLATCAVVVFASASTDTKLAPLVQAFGMLVLLVTVIATTNIVIKKRVKK